MTVKKLKLRRSFYNRESHSTWPHPVSSSQLTDSSPTANQRVSHPSDQHSLDKVPGVCPGLHKCYGCVLGTAAPRVPPPELSTPPVALAVPTELMFSYTSGPVGVRGSPNPCDLRRAQEAVPAAVVQVGFKWGSGREGGVHRKMEPRRETASICITDLVSESLLLRQEGPPKAPHGHAEPVMDATEHDAETGALRPLVVNTSHCTEWGHFAAGPAVLDGHNGLRVSSGEQQQRPAGSEPLSPGRDGAQRRCTGATMTSSGFR
ncbi:hypothetical protein MHYP_G00217590 [Metynnis hypsauchen]